MDAATRELVRRRADNDCEYCLLCQEHSAVPHQSSISSQRSMAGPTTRPTWRLRVTVTISARAPTFRGIDPLTGELVALFHPRRDRRADHFTIRVPRIEGVTPCGRATVRVLAMNDVRRLELRSELSVGGRP
jgi:hypothetical protein